MQTDHPSVPSLFGKNEVKTDLNVDDLPQKKRKRSLLDLLYGGFYLVFLIKNNYVPQSTDQLREDVNKLLQNFENQAKRLDFKSEDVHQAKYAFCALIDETIVAQSNPLLDQVKLEWLERPLQLTLFGSQLAGEVVFNELEGIRGQGIERLDLLEVYYYCLLMGFKGKYRLDAPEKINYLIARVGDEIRYLKGKQLAFAPSWNIPDKIRHAIRGEVPLAIVGVFIGVLALSAYGVMNYHLNTQTMHTLKSYAGLIKQPDQYANLTIYLP